MGWGDYIFNGGFLGHMRPSVSFSGDVSRVIPPANARFVPFMRVIPAGGAGNDVLVAAGYRASLPGVEQSHINSMFISPDFLRVSGVRSVTVSNINASVDGHLHINHDENQPNLFGRAFPFICPPAAAVGSVLRFFGI